MTFCIITHVPHGIKDSHFFAYAPYVREMNIWLKHVDEVLLVAPLEEIEKSVIHLNYSHPKIKLIPVSKIDLLGIKSILKSILKIPKIGLQIFSAMKTSDHIHLRSPGNIGLLGCILQIFFPKKSKTAKYAGNWDPKAKQPWSYKLQKWILSNTFLTKNMQVLVYGEWGNQSKNIMPFFTATYTESDKKPVEVRNLEENILFLFVGTLSKGKRPLYAIQLIEKLYHKGFNVSLSLYGEGKELENLQEYIHQNDLNEIIHIKGNQTQEVLKKVYQESHFLLLPSKSEGWPKVVAEAMFWGCFPMVTKVSCLPYMVDNSNRGMLLKMNMDADVAQISAVLKNQKEYNYKVQESILWSRKYTLDLFENEIKALLD